MDDVAPPGVPFDEDTWRQLPDFLDQLPEPVCLHAVSYTHLTLPTSDLV